MCGGGWRAEIEAGEWIELSRKMRALGKERTVELMFHSLDADKSGELRCALVPPTAVAPYMPYLNMY